ncbi:MAG: hypothetical protein WBN10_17370 [Polyangiales bacterium]
MKSLFLVLALASTVLWLGCGDDRPPGTAGNDSSLVGGPCMNNSECEQGLCEDGSSFPGGTCTVSCGNSGNCPQDSSCGELDTGWVCLVDCRDTPDCRTDYLCEPVTEAGTNQTATVSVCIGPAG